MLFTKSNRRGQVTMSLEFVDQAMKRGLQPFARVIPVHVDVRWHEKRMIVAGFSPDFDEVPEGEITPEYEALFVDGRHAPHFRRVTLARWPQP